MSIDKLFVPPRQSVCVVVINDDYEILTATRRHTNILSLPGGKVDAGESIYDAVRRECFEETGILLHEDFLTPVYSEIIVGELDGIDYYCTAFAYNMLCDVRMAIVNTGNEKEWMVEDGIKVKFASYDDLATGAFSEFNDKVIKNMIKMKAVYTK